MRNGDGYLPLCFGSFVTEKREEIQSKIKEKREELTRQRWLQLYKTFLIGGK